MEKIKVKGISISCGGIGCKRSIITFNPASGKYKTYLYPHDKELTKASIRTFLNNFDVSFPNYLDIPEGGEE